jgi:hypothetical protein
MVSKSENRETARFQAEAADGRSFTIVEFTAFVITLHREGAKTRQGRSMYILDDGRHVSATRDADRFTVWPDGLSVRRRGA